MKTRRMLLTGLAALTTLVFSAGCGGGSAAEPPVSQGPEDNSTPPPLTATNFLDLTRELILTRTSDSAEPVALPGEEVVDVESAEPYYDEDFFR